MAEYRFLDEKLTFDERVDALLAELTLDEKLSLLTTHMNEVPRLGIKEFWIGAEVARGLVCRDDKNGEAPTTVFPEPFGLAATFDRDVMKRMGEIAGIETRIYHDKGRASLCVWGPTVDLERDPRWGRTEEGYGEDPCLTGTMAAAYTLGMAGDDEKYRRVIPTLKHFYANNNEDTRINCNAGIPDRLKHEYYLRAFEKPVREGRAGSLMTSYNEVNGVEQIVSLELQKYCREQWGLLFAVTDGGDFIQNVQYHRRDFNHTEALAKIYNHNGADIMTDNEEIVRTAAREALDKGLITVGNIDSAIRGALKARFMLGEFDKKTPFDNYSEKLLCSDEYYQAALEAAEKSVILLRNSRAVLPLSKESKLAVIGYHADMNFRDWYTGLSPKTSTILDVLTAEVGRENIIYDNGNDIIALRSASSGFYFSVSEDGTVKCDTPLINETCLFELFEWGNGAVSLRSKFNNRFLSDNGVMKCTAVQPFGWYVKELFYLERNGSDCMLKNWQKRFLYVNGSEELAVSPALHAPKSAALSIEIFSDGTERVRRLATEAHQTVVFCGNNPMINARETTDRKDLKLPEKQSRNLDAVIGMNPDTVLFLVSGYPYELEKRHLATVMHICHAGPAMGAAVAEALFGDISPAGRCPVTWYKSMADLCDIEDYNLFRTRSTYLYFDGEPLFPFGYGLSYTAFRYKAIKTDKQSYTSGETVSVSFELENVGAMDGEEVVQLYASAPASLPLTKPKKQLVAFSRVFVPRGERVTVELSFRADDLSFWNMNKDSFDLFSGCYTLMAGASSADIRRTADIQINGSEYEGLDVSGMVPATAAFDLVGAEFDADRELREYLLINDWQSIVTFEFCRLKGYHNIEVTASNPGSAVKLNFVTDDGRNVAEVEIPPTASLTEFVTVSAPAEPVDGVVTLRLTASGMVSLRSFRLF